MHAHHNDAKLKIKVIFVNMSCKKKNKNRMVFHQKKDWGSPRK